MDQLELLRQLQHLDGELYRLRKQQKEKPNELEEAKAKVSAQELRVKAAEDKVKALQLSQKEKEVELQGREENIKKFQGQLFQVKTNKEYTALQHEISALKADNSLLEETILKTFDAVDQALSENKREHVKLEEERKRFNDEQSRIETELADISERVSRLEQDRKRITPDVPEQSLMTYERVLKIRDGLALVPLINESCGGCHRRMPPQVINEVFLKAKLVTCENCNRILVHD